MFFASTGGSSWELPAEGVGQGWAFAGPPVRRGALAEELNTRPLVAHGHLGLGGLYRQTGKRVESDEHLTTATTMLDV